jgi:hypothetical protein
MKDCYLAVSISVFEVIKFRKLKNLESKQTIRFFFF